MKKEILTRDQIKILQVISSEEFLSKNASDFTKMIIKIPNKAWINFFNLEAKKLKSKIIE